MSEQEEGSEDDAVEDEAEAVQVSEPEEEAQAVYKRPRKTKASAARAGGSGRGTTQVAVNLAGDSSDEDAELQQALALSLMEAHQASVSADQGHTSAPVAPSEQSLPRHRRPEGSSPMLYQRQKVPKEKTMQQRTVQPKRGVPRGGARGERALTRVHSRKRRQKAKGKPRRRGAGASGRPPRWMPALSLCRAPLPCWQAPRAPSQRRASKRCAWPACMGKRLLRRLDTWRRGKVCCARVGQDDYVLPVYWMKMHIIEWQAWGEVRGGELPEGCMEDMLTYGAEVTGSQSMTASAFEQLVCCTQLLTWLHDCLSSTTWVERQAMAEI